MFRNYLTVATRNMIRDRWYTGIDILGLALGMAGGSCPGDAGGKSEPRHRTEG